ncbi:MAG: phosphoenolpyruvate carboxykinase [Lachnospiraceae bacterium]|nr:phosphoenolpyruvate carboxykinase [Lachnospiraceae bacterium]
MKKGSRSSSSVITDDMENICYLCGCYGNTEVHHIFGGSVRQISDKYGLVVHLCPMCHKKLHDHGEGKQYLHEIGQQVYEEQIGTREQFIQEFIRSYL